MAGPFNDLDTSFRGVVGRLVEALDGELDDQPGSVVRTLLEAFGREIATFYAMLDRAYDAGFVDTASGDALDKVVSLLGVERARAGRLAGAIEFVRTTPAPQDIAIPAGFQCTGKLTDGNALPLFETVEDAVIVRGATRGQAPIQEIGDPNGGDAELLIGAGQLTIMPRPALGIESLSNPLPLRRSREDESDEHLRARARETLRRAQVGTIESITAALVAQGVEHVEVIERKDGPPGVIDVLIGDENFEADPKAQERVQAALRATKAAGIRVEMSYLRTVYIQPTAKILPLDPRLDEITFRRLSEQVARTLGAAVASSPRGQMIDRRRVEAQLLACPGVSDARLLGLDAHTLERGEVRLRPSATEHGIALGSHERAVIDLDRWPPRIVRAQHHHRVLDLVIDAPESALQSLRAALESALTGLAARASRTDAGEANSPKLLEVLAETLRAASPTGSPVSLVEAMLTDEVGAARLIAADDRIDKLIGDAEVVLGKLKLRRLEQREGGP